MSESLPREMAILGVYMPSLTLLLLACLVAGWIFDRALAWLGLYNHIWHPTLFRVSLITCIYGVLALHIYF